VKHAYQRWQDYQPSKQQTLWVALGCVVATLIFGFGLAGWVTAGTAQAKAEAAATASRNDLAAAVCAEQFLRSAKSNERLKKLAATEWWQRDEQLVAGGWATMPGEAEASATVAEMCASRLSEHAQARSRAAPLSAEAR
jgi:hypothetical protein